MNVILDVVLGNATADLDQKLRLSKASLEAAGGHRQRLGLEIVQHHNVRARFDGFRGLVLRLALDVDLECKAADGASCFDGLGDGAWPEL
jgi:hypothetical protein